MPCRNQPQPIWVWVLVWMWVWLRCVSVLYPSSVDDVCGDCQFHASPMPTPSQLHVNAMATPCQAHCSPCQFQSISIAMPLRPLAETKLKMGKLGLHISKLTTRCADPKGTLEPPWASCTCPVANRIAKRMEPLANSTMGTPHATRREDPICRGIPSSPVMRRSPRGNRKLCPEQCGSWSRG